MNNEARYPAFLILRILRLITKEKYYEEIAGDLYEYYAQKSHLSKWKRRVLLNFHALQFCRPWALKPLLTYREFNQYSMFQNYLKVGMRNILKYKLFSFINVFGLAVAMSVCLLIILMLADQKSYDQFHQDKDRIYRILGVPAGSIVPYATTTYSLGEILEQDYPVISEAASLHRSVGGDASFNQKTVELTGYFTDNSFFSIFDFPLLHGDRASVLKNPNTIVISQQKAYQLFNSENPVGKQVLFEDRGLSVLNVGEGHAPERWGLYTVDGVVDMNDVKSHLKFDLLMSTASRSILYQDSLLTDVSNKWQNQYTSYHYVRLAEETKPEQLEELLADVVKRKMYGIEELEDYKLTSQKLTKITPGMLVNNEGTFRLPELAYYVLGLLALIVMVLACLNYTTLSIARALTRMKEIGVRKVTGASRKSLVAQFCIESMLIAFFALIVAMLMLYFTKEAFMDLWFNQYLNFRLRTSLSIIPLFISFAMFIGLIAGLFPALSLSRKKPLEALRSVYKVSGKWGLQKALNVSQFVVSLLFIVTTMVVYSQFIHYTDFEYGINSENVLNIPMQGNDYDLLIQELSSVPGVEKISACDYIPATGTTSAISIKKPDAEMEDLTIMQFKVDHSFVENFNINILSGTALSSANEQNKYILVNEAALDKMGYENANDAIGQVWISGRKTSFQIIGVVENFRASLLVNGDDYRPLILNYKPKDVRFLNVRISEGDPRKTIAAIKEVWKSLDPIHEFKYNFYDTELADTNLAIFDIVSIIGYLAGLAILISCLGLLGMATYTTERRVKEIGIRKVLGAAELLIVYVLSKGFLKLLAISILIAAPLSYFLNRLWLDSIPNRVDFDFLSIIYGIAIMVVLGLVTIGSQTLRAAKANPVESLKDE